MLNPIGFVTGDGGLLELDVGDNPWDNSLLGGGCTRYENFGDWSISRFI